MSISWDDVEQHQQNILNKFEPTWTNLNQFGQVWSILNLFEPFCTDMNQFVQVKTNLDKLEHIWTSWNMFGLIQFAEIGKCLDLDRSCQPT